VKKDMVDRRIYRFGTQVFVTVSKEIGLLGEDVEVIIYNKMDSTALNGFIDPSENDFWRCIADIADQRKETKEIAITIDVMLENAKREKINEK
jgi:hypothetical protein